MKMQAYAYKRPIDRLLDSPRPENFCLANVFEERTILQNLTHYLILAKYYPTDGMFYSGDAVATPYFQTTTRSDRF